MKRRREGEKEEIEREKKEREKKESPDPHGDFMAKPGAIV